jgi:hypothetical protein
VAAELLAALDRPQPRALAEVLLRLRTGAVFAAGLDRSDTSFALFLQAWDALVDGSVAWSASPSA